jgi:heme-degrading monooxygenase HmoA
MAYVSRGFRGKRAKEREGSRVPPGQYLVDDFPVLSAGPTPHIPLDQWTFTIESEVAELKRWSWEAFRAHTASSARCSLPHGGSPIRATVRGHRAGLVSRCHRGKGERMHARVTRLDAPAGSYEDGIAMTNDQVIPSLKGIEGFVGAYFLGDRETGKLMSVVLWDSAEHMRASEEMADRIRGDAATAAQGTIQSVERFEVVAQA